ncbi:MAG TPA: hypothetical protein VNM49_13905 [Paenibacillus cookii]|nr:hypothetical protein [Paenibacillus cookii]
MKQLNAASLSDIITEGIDKTLAKAMPNAGPDELEHRRQQMSKAELMDAYLLSFDQDLTGQIIHEVVLRVFGLDLDHALVLPEAEREIRAAAERRLGGMQAGSSPIPPRDVIDLQLAECGRRLAGPEVRRLLNQLFGVNLDAISALDKARISLFSKGQWIVRQDRDLFVVYTGEGDIDVSVYPTAYFRERTGQDELPEDLGQALADLGYSPVAEGQRYYYVHPDGQAVPDAFKGQTMGAIMASIRNAYSHL